MLTERTKSSIRLFLESLNGFYFIYDKKADVYMSVESNNRDYFIVGCAKICKESGFALLLEDIIISKQEFLVATLNMIVKHEFRGQQNR